MRTWVRTILVGRPDGLRAELRKRTGVLSWIDEPGGLPWLEEQPADEDSTSTVHGAHEAVVTEGPVSGWVRVIDAAEVGPGQLAEVFVAERAILVTNVDGTLHAVDSVCPHAGGPLADGMLEGALITCPWHGWSFDVRDGKSSVDENATLTTFPVRVESGGILVKV